MHVPLRNVVNARSTCENDHKQRIVTMITMGHIVTLTAVRIRAYRPVGGFFESIKG